MSGTSGLAIASLVLGICGFLFCLNGAPLSLPIGVAGIVTGHLGKKRIRESSGQTGGAGMATAGLILSYLLIAGFVVAILGVGGLTIFGDGLRQFFGASASALER